jgi:hypothetical protein
MLQSTIARNIELGGACITVTTQVHNQKVETKGEIGERIGGTRRRRAANSIPRVGLWGKTT